MDHVLKCHEIVKTDFVRGDGCHLYDAQGRQYTDFESGIWCTGLGHNHPRIAGIMHAQIDRLMHLGTRYPHMLAEEAAVDVLEVVGIADGKCVFLSSGSEAVEFGVQTARRITGKNAFLTFANSYLAAHGSAGAKDPAEWHLLDWSACADTEECLRGIPFEKLGAFVFEPGGSGSAFVKFPPKELVREVAQRVKSAGGMVVANEVTTGMGRTGRWCGFQHYDIQPDIVALGKGLGNGYPVSAVAVSAEIARRLEDSGFHYAQSHQNDPLGCAVAREVIAVLRDENLIERGNAVGAFLLQELKRLGGRRALVKKARGRGALAGLELHQHKEVSAATAYRALLESGFVVGYYPAGSMLRFSPPLTMEEPDVTRLVDRLDGILASV